MADTEGVTIGTIERAIGASRGVISKAIAKGTDIQSKWLELICEQYPKYSPIWLLTGEGSMLRDGNVKPINHTDQIDEPIVAKNITEQPRQFSQNDMDATLIDRFMTTIKEQAEEIGRLKERIAQLEREKNESEGSFQSVSRTETVGSL